MQATQARANHSPPASRDLIDGDEVKAHHSIVDVVARYVPLRRTGRTFVGPCPFHHDTGRPNLVIFPATSSWYCFRCKEGGGAIAFVEKRERVGFLDAVAWLTGNLLPVPKSPLPRLDAWRSLTTPLPEPDADSLRIVQGAAMAYYATLLDDPDTPMKVAEYYFAGCGKVEAGTQMLKMAYRLMIIGTYT